MIEVKMTICAMVRDEELPALLATMTAIQGVHKRGEAAVSVLTRDGRDPVLTHLEWDRSSVDGSRGEAQFPRT